MIGASIFSPRPGRGYRFHSLQVEIIAIPSRLSKPPKLRQFEVNPAISPIWFVVNALL